MSQQPYTLEPCSPHDDMCIFATKTILKGELVYSTKSPKLSFDISQDWYDTLNQKMQKQVLENGYFDELEEAYHADFDVLPFIQHSKSPNVAQEPSHDDMYLVAVQDIQPGGEITR